MTEYNNSLELAQPGPSQFEFAVFNTIPHSIPASVFEQIGAIAANARHSHAIANNLAQYNFAGYDAAAQNARASITRISFAGNNPASAADRAELRAMNSQISRDLKAARRALRAHSATRATHATPATRQAKTRHAAPIAPQRASNDDGDGDGPGDGPNAGDALRPGSIFNFRDLPRAAHPQFYSAPADPILLANKKRHAAIVAELAALFAGGVPIFAPFAPRAAFTATYAYPLACVCCGARTERLYCSDRCNSVAQYLREARRCRPTRINWKKQIPGPALRKSREFFLSLIAGGISFIRTRQELGDAVQITEHEYLGRRLITA